MCFSAAASFGAGVVLTSTGVASIKSAKKTVQLPFVSIPMLFAIQQFIEGLLWIALAGTDLLMLQTVSTYAFLFFAFVVWPLWIPMSLTLLENRSRIRMVLYVLLTMGGMVSLTLGWFLLHYDVGASIREMHIHYWNDFPYFPPVIVSMLYLAPTVFSLFVSSVPRAWMLGAAILVAYVITKVFYEFYLISVWCFFAALLSMLTLAVIRYRNRRLPSVQIIPSS